MAAATTGRPMDPRFTVYFTSTRIGVTFEVCPFRRAGPQEAP